MRIVRPSVNWKKYLSPKNKIVGQYLSRYGDDFLKQTINKIKLAYTQNQNSIVLIEFQKVDIVSILEKDEYELALSYLMSLCEKLEKYELCAEIQKVQKMKKPMNLRQRQKHKIK